MKQLTFYRLRKYLSKLDRLSICKRETLSYKNFVCVDDVPKKYDRYYVIGIGRIESEFYITDTPLCTAQGENEKRVLLPCIEIVVSRKPKEPRR